MTKNQTQHEKATPDWSASKNDLLDQISDREVKIQVKTQLMDNMAYQIRTLSNAVIGFSELLLSEDITPSQIEYLQEINESGYELSALVSEVLDWNQMLSGDLVIQKTKCELSEIIEHLEQTLVAATKDKEIDYQILTDPVLPRHLFTDDVRLLRCLLNLVDSAITWTPEASVQIHVATEVSHVLGPVIRFDIRDSGVGFDEESVAHSHEPYRYHIESDPGLAPSSVSGLKVTAGSLLTKQLVELLGGNIDVESEGGLGCTFSLRIPVGMDGAARPAENLSVQNVCQPTDTPAGVILLVEDQPANRTVISLMLEALGVDVDTAADGEEALQKIEDNSYSVILMDLKMPKMDGYEATRRLREKKIETPIVALSAKVINGDEHHQIATMFDGFLTKPVDSQKLSEVLQKFVRGFKKSSPSEQDAVVLNYGD